MTGSWPGARNGNLIQTLESLKMKPVVDPQITECCSLIPVKVFRLILTSHETCNIWSVGFFLTWPQSIINKCCFLTFQMFLFISPPLLRSHNWNHQLHLFDLRTNIHNLWCNTSRQLPDVFTSRCEPCLYLQQQSKSVCWPKPPRVWWVNSGTSSQSPSSLTCVFH